MPKPVPHFWWDFADDTTAVIVQSDYPGGECLARFPIVGKSGEPAINQAAQLIRDFKAGRKTPNWKR